MLQTLDTSRSNEIDIERNSTGRTWSLSSNHVWINNWHPLPRHTGQIGVVLCDILEKIYRDISGVHCIYRMALHCLCELSLWLLLLILLYCESINEIEGLHMAGLSWGLVAVDFTLMFQDYFTGLLHPMLVKQRWRMSANMSDESSQNRYTINEAQQKQCA